MPRQGAGSLPDVASAVNQTVALVANVLFGLLVLSLVWFEFVIVLPLFWKLQRRYPW